MRRALKILGSSPPTLAALVSLYALYRLEGTSPVLVVVVLSVAAALFTPHRIGGNPAVIWILRVLAYLIVIFVNLPRRVDMLNMFDPHTMIWFGELCAAELGLSAWTAGADGRLNSRLLWMSGAVLLASTSTPEEGFMPIIAPIYFALILLAFRSMGSAGSAPASRPSWRFAAVVGFVLAIGLVGSLVMQRHRAALTTWGMQVLSERLPAESGALAVSPLLTSSFGDRGSMTRAMLIRGEGDYSHLRGISFDIYRDGEWGPRTLDKHLERLVSDEFEPQSPGHRVTVTRLLANHGLCFVPLNMVGVTVPGSVQMTAGRNLGGEIRLSSAAPSTYEFVLNDQDQFQGPLCTPPDAPTRERLLHVSRTVDPRVRQLAAGLIAKITDPRRRIAAIEHYLLSNYRYSLDVRINRGDPVSQFLLEKKAGHCQFFASSMVILARMAGIPARYVIGYYAHERDGDVTVVRQRDAHAWAECWIDGSGWVTVDATPGDGRPDALSAGPSPVGRFLERMQDVYLAWSLNGDRRPLWWILGGAAASAGLFMLIRSFWMLLRRREAAGRSIEYSPSDPALRALFQSFERGARRLGLRRSPSKTWRETLNTLSEEQRAAIAPGTLELATRIIDVYYLMRFADGDTPEMRDNLARLCREFELLRTAGNRTKTP